MPSASVQSPVEKLAFVSLGCPKNLVDSESMLGLLTEAGYQLVSDHDDADAIVINTCGFLEASKQESLEVIREAIERKKNGTLQRVVVAGCLAQRYRAKLLDWAPGIDAIIGVFDRDHIVDAVGGQSAATGDDEPSHDRDDADSPLAASPRYWIAANALQAAEARGVETVGLTVQGADGKGVGYFEDDARRYRLTPRHWAYLRVSEGCNQRCAFCTIPSIRGKMRSKPLYRIIHEARRLFADGAFELNLIGQDTTSYGYDIYGGRDEGTEGRRDAGKRARKERGTRRAANLRAETDGDLSYPGDLIGMLTALNDVANEFGPTGGVDPCWVRLMYVYPTHFTDDMIDAIAALPNIVKYIDIPLQHISDRMLKTMRRNITRKEQETLLLKLRDRIPGLAIRTTFITGFPGETERDHSELVNFVEDFGFDMMGVFQYSHEDGTPAGTMDDDPALHVPDGIKAEREAELMFAQQEVAFENARYVAEQRGQFDVLIDGPAAEGHGNSGDSVVGDDAARYVGRCYHQAPQVDSVTYVDSASPLVPGELVRCTIVDADGYDLIARPTEQLQQKTTLPILG